jgi:hypothetical protein
MICKIVINRIIALIFLSTISSANAGLINTANDSYIDDVTGLEWMDFGVTAGMSYNHVMGLISDGGQYEDWVTPTFNQVQVLYNGNFGIVDTVRYIRGNFSSAYDANDRCFWSRCVSEYDALFYIVGQTPTSVNTAGLYLDERGGLRYVQHRDFNRSRSYDNVTINIRNTRYNRESYFSTHSTLLIKKTEDFAAPEPSTLAIFALGMIGLASRRFKKK